VLPVSKKKPGKKPRTEYVYGTTKSKVTQLEVSVDPQTGEISFGENVGNMYSEVTYDRPKGPKVLSRIPQNGMLTFSADSALRKNFDFICAVDTNTKIIRRKRVSVVGIVTVKDISIPGPKDIQRYWAFDVPFGIEYIELKPPPENFGWIAALQHLHSAGHVKETTQIGMIVDSDLGNINAYNQRKTPILDPMFLPPNVQLIYASADAGKESIVNKSLGIADSLGSQVLRTIESGQVPFNTTVLNNELFEGYRVVQVNAIKTGII
jgi:hypothetical protein